MGIDEIEINKLEASTAHAKQQYRQLKFD